MWALAAVELIKLLREKKVGLVLSVIALIVAGTVGWKGKAYIDVAQAASIVRIDKNEADIDTLSDNHAQVTGALGGMAATIGALSDNLKALQTTMQAVDTTNRAMSAKIVDIYHGIYEIKLNQKTTNQ